MPTDAAPGARDTYLHFDGKKSFIQVASIPEYSVPTAGALTVSAWIRHDVDEFPHAERSGYVHWMGKGTDYGPNGDQEWVCRMYSKTTTDCPRRPHRTSFYVFNPEGQLGVGSYVEDPLDQVRLHGWRHIVGVADDARTYLYRNGQMTHCDTYRGPAQGNCEIHYTDDTHTTQLVIDPQAGNSPLRIGTLNGDSFFLGGITRVRIWGAKLTDTEIGALYRQDAVPQTDKLVAEFMLDADTGTTAVDSARGNHGMICYGRWAVQA